MPSSKSSLGFALAILFPLFLGPLCAGEDLAESLKEANRLLGARQSKKALEILEPLESSNPKSAEVQFALAQARIMEKDLPKAKANLQKTIELDPAHSRARLLLASILRTEKKPKEAARQVEEVLKRSPKDATALKTMGEIEMDGKRFEKAAGWFEKALAEKPEDVPLASLVATAWTESVKSLVEGPKAKRDGHGEKAMAALERVLKLKPDLVDVHFNVGTVAILCERWDDAVKHLETYLEKKPGNGPGLYNLAKALESAERPKEAIEAWKKFIDAAEKGKDKTLKADISKAKTRIKVLEKELKSPKKKKAKKSSDDEEPSRKAEPVPKLGL
jgi:tetratricopeptide (TPR) repeat protein